MPHYSDTCKYMQVPSISQRYPSCSSHSDTALCDLRSRLGGIWTYKRSWSHLNDISHYISAIVCVESESVIMESYFRHDVITETSDKMVIYHEVTIRKKSHQQHDNITINHDYSLPQQSILMNLSYFFLWLILSKPQSQYNQDFYMINCD